MGSEIPPAWGEEKMPYSQVPLNAGGSRWTSSVPQAQRKLPLKFVPSQTCGNFVELQIWMTGLLFVLVVMQVSKTLHDVQMKLDRWGFTGQCRRSVEVMDGKEVLAHQEEERLWTGVRAAVRKTLEYGSGTYKIDRGEQLWLVQVKVAQGRLWGGARCLCPSRRCQKRMGMLLLFHHISQEETEGKAMLKSSEEAGKAFIVYKTWKTKAIRWKLIYFTYLHFECLEFTKPYLRGWVFLDCF